MRYRPDIVNLSYKENDTEKVTERDQKKEEVLAQCFHSVFIREPGTEIPVRDIKTFKEPFDNIEITPDKVKRVLAKFKRDKTRGPDNIHQRVLKKTRKEISIVLAYILNTFIIAGNIPSDRKDAQIFARYKKGN